MFMAGKKPAFTEMQPNEVLPLDFARLPQDESDQATDLEMELDSENLGFVGVPSSYLKPNSDP